MAVPTLRGVGTVSQNVGAMTPGYPTGTAVGDLVFMVAESADAGVALTCTDWTSILTADPGLALSSNTRLTILQRIVSNVATDNRTTNDTGNHQAGYIIGVQVGTFDPTPVNVSNTGTLGTPSTAVSVPGAVTTAADCLCIAVATGNLPDADTTTEFGAPTNASLSSLTEQIDFSTSTGNGGAIWIVTGAKATAGTVSATTCTAATSANRAYGFIAVQPIQATTQNLTGTLFTKAPTFFTGVLTARYTLTGTLFTKAPTFFTGTVTATRALTGVLFTKAPTFNVGNVIGSQLLTGTLFTKAPTFPTGTVTATYALTGTLFQKAPTFPQGAVTTGAYALTGTLFVKAPTFPTGTVTPGAVNLTGVLFTKAPTFSTGTVAATYTLNGVLFVKAPTFPTGTIGQTGTLFGNLFVKAPTFFTGSLAQGGPSFWQPNPAGWTANPSAFVRVGRYGPSPWGAELSGQRFEKAPTFSVGTVS